jgi:hypothetical protein
MNGWSVLWLGWLLVTGVVFGVVEGTAIEKNKLGDALGKPRQNRTLTEQVRVLFAFDKDGFRRRHAAWRRVAFLMVFLPFSAWLFLHFTHVGGLY